jgi:hypothetical protein
MSSAVYPLGMNSKPSSGYTHKSNYNKEYVSWKGTGVNSYPVGTSSGHIRPLTNKDPGNVFPTGFGLPRPIKHYRKGRVIPPVPVEGIPNLNVNSPYYGNELSIDENGLINYNINRFVKSSKGSSLGGGSGGSGLLNDLQGNPGSYIVKLNTLNETDGVNKMDDNCQVCEGIGIVASYKPNVSYLSENPEANDMNSILCCNQEHIAKQRVLYASTNLKKNYYTTTKQYLQNRCKTYDQKAFNFLENNFGSQENKPGSPLALNNTYLANCQLTPRDCNLTVYKPNNYQYAKQGAVSSSTRLLKLNVDTITTNSASIQNYNKGSNLITANELYSGNNNNVMNLLKNKAPSCNTPLPMNMKSNQFQNKKNCHFQNDLPSYHLPKSEPGPYRYYPGTVFRTNRYAQSPYNYQSR